MNEKQKLLKNFKQVAQQIAPPGGLPIEIGGAILRSLSIYLTRLLQATGYNKRKLQTYGDLPLILNVGCGDMTAGNCVTTDILPSGGQFLKLLLGKHPIKNDLFLDITVLDRHLVDRADGIVLSHVLEHLPAVVVLQALGCCFSYLKPGGCLRVSVPYLGIYDRPHWPKLEELGSALLAKNLLAYGWGHRFMYDVELLTVLMEEAGFQEVREVIYGEDLLGELDTPWRKSQSIYLLGFKPKSPSVQDLFKP